MINMNINSLGYTLNCGDDEIKKEFKFSKKIIENNCKAYTKNGTKNGQIFEQEILLEEFTTLLKTTEYEKILEKTNNFLNKKQSRYNYIPQRDLGGKRFYF